MHVTFDSLKTFYNILLQKLKNHRGNWEQNDHTADDYIKNRPFYSRVEEVKLVDNLTQNNYNDGNKPSCHFIPNQSYNVVWNGILYENLVCFYDGEFNIIAGPDNGEGSFCIDDDGGGGLYIESNEVNWTVSISTKQEVVHQIDKKYVPMPDDIMTEDDVYDAIDEFAGSLSNVAWSGNYYDLNNIPDMVGFDDIYNYKKSITWNGNTANKDKITFNGYLYFKVSDLTPEFNLINSVSSTRTDNTSLISLWRGTNCYRAGFCIVVTKAGTCKLSPNNNSTMFSFTAPSTGIYFYYYSTSTYANNLTFVMNNPNGMYMITETGDKSTIIGATDNGILTVIDKNNVTKILPSLEKKEHNFKDFLSVSGFELDGDPIWDREELFDNLYESNFTKVENGEVFYYNGRAFRHVGNISSFDIRIPIEVEEMVSQTGSGFSIYDSKRFVDSYSTDNFGMVYFYHENNNLGWHGTTRLEWTTQIGLTEDGKVFFYNSGYSYAKIADIKTYKKSIIAEKYIPDTLARTSSVVNKIDTPESPEVGQVLSVKEIDENGKITWETVAQASGGGSIATDTTLSIEGSAADAKAVGDAIGELELAIETVLPSVTTEDVGKFLRVSADGTWVTESIPNAEEATF